MKKCVDCGCSMEQIEKFCSSCGRQQPEAKPTNEDAKFSASIGDKNVVSGNIIGKNEEYNITGPTTINKIEDETKKFISCAVSGQHLLRGRDTIINCPKCKADVAHACYNFSALRCYNCDKLAFQKYTEVVDIILNNGIIDIAERIQLDELASNLLIDSDTKLKLELEAKQRFTNRKQHESNLNSSDLTGYFKIEFQKAKARLYNENDYDSALSSLKSVHAENINNDEVAYYYFMLKALHVPESFVADIENSQSKNIDHFWEDYWSFMPELLVKGPQEAFKRIILNKARFSQEASSLAFCDLLAYLVLYIQTKEESYIQEAASVYHSIEGSVNLHLQQVFNFVGKLITDRNIDNLDFAIQLHGEERFYLNKLLGIKTANETYAFPEESTAVQDNKPRESIVPQLSILGGDFMGQMMNNFNTALDNFSTPKFVSLSVPMPDVKKYYFILHGQTKGPYSSTEMITFIKDGLCGRDTMVWHEGVTDWQMASHNTEINALFNR